MVMPTRSRGAVKNLREGIKKMGKVMTPAALVRREFQLGRRMKPGEMVPLHRTAVWQKATDALANLRERMTAANLNPEHVTASIIFIEIAAPDTPQMIALDKPGRSLEECRELVFETIGRDDVIALGLIMQQYDEAANQTAAFPYFFMRLNERGMAVMLAAAEIRQKEVARNNTTH